jgi:dUTP pyrophosphatase
MNIGVKAILPGAQLPEYKTTGAAAFDLSAAEPITIQPGEMAMVRTGLVFDVPEGYFLAIFSRSSTPKRGLQVPHGVGVLDSDYNGPNDEAGILVRNVTDQAVHVAAGDRLAQGVILPCPRVTFVPYEPTGKDRGGFGSTGQ